MPDYDTTSLAAGTAAHLEAYDKLLQNAKVSDAFVKANPEMLKDMGFQTPQQYHALSALDKIAATTGYLKAQGAKEYQARMSEMQAQNEARQNAVRADEDAGVFLQRYGKLAAAGTDPRKAFYQTLEEMPTGFNAGRAMPRIMDSLQRWQEATAPTDKSSFFKPEDLNRPLPPGYERIVLGPNTSQAVAIPTSEGPAKTADGGYYFDGKKWMTAKGIEVSPDKVLTSLDRENASLRALVPYAFSPEEKRAMENKISQNDAAITDLRGGSGRTSQKDPAKTSAASRFKIVEVK